MGMFLGILAGLCLIESHVSRPTRLGIVLGLCANVMLMAGKRPGHSYVALTCHNLNLDADLFGVCRCSRLKARPCFETGVFIFNVSFNQRLTLRE
jgi:hypothetical protein